MKVCVVGVGAIGGFIGTRLAVAGRCETSALARGDTLRALREQGWWLRQGGRVLQAPAIVADDAHALGPQDIVVIAVKSTALAALAPTLGPLLGPETVVMPAMNGVPWWFCQGVAGLAGAPLHSIDPEGAIAAALPRHRVIGCVVHASAVAALPGRIEHRMGDGLIVGEPDGGTSERVRGWAAELRHAGFETTESADIRKDIWYKLWGNLTMNPISAITGATIDRVLDDELVRTLCTDAMEEMARVGRHIGCAVSQSAEDRHAITRRLGAFKTSMLQDVEAGRALELGAIVGAVHEIAQRLSVPTPNIAALFGLTRLFAREKGLYPGP